MKKLGALTIIITGLAFGQEVAETPKVGELVTDRPDFTESAEVVPKGWLQWESGFQFDRTGTSRGYTFGAPLFRIGLTDRLELRLSSDGVVGAREARDPIKRGMADAAIGFKYKIRNEGRWLPAMALIPAVSLPSGHPAFTSSSADPGVKFAWGKDMPAGFSVSGNMNYNSLTDPVGRYQQNAATLSVGHGFTERFAGYWELYTFNCDERDSGRMTVFQTGFTTAVGKNTQLDISVARRLTSVGPDWMFAFGWATRHPFGLRSWLKK